MLKIFLTDLAAYNKGFLIGDWISLPIDQKDLNNNLTRILQQGSSLSYFEGYCYEKHEEWFITDFEWEEVDLFDIGEYEDIFKLNEKLLAVDDFDETKLKAIKFLLDMQIVEDIEEAILKSDDVFIHNNSYIEDLAYELLNECYCVDKLPSIIANNIDYEAVGRELILDGRFFEVGADVYEYIG